ncbi:MAG: Hsp20/alpha crystallin family protein [Gemmatimonadota bacterium]|jgi:HSP20 family protein
MKDESRDRTSVEDLLADVEAYIDEWFRGKLPFTFARDVRWTPPTDVYETETDIRVTMAVPGIRVENVAIEFDRGVLTVRGERREACSDRRRYYTMEIPVGSFGRRVRISRPVDPDGIKVTYTDGLLRVTLPKVRSDRLDVPID